MHFWFTPNPVNAGETVELLGTLKDEYGSPVYPAQVGVEYSTNGGGTWNYIWTLNTNSAGEVSTIFTAPGVGEYLVRVSYGGSAVYNPSSDTETLVVNGGPPPIESWIYFVFKPNPCVAWTNSHS